MEPSGLPRRRISPLLFIFGNVLQQGHQLRLMIGLFIVMAIQMIGTDIDHRKYGVPQKWCRVIACLKPRYQIEDMV